MMVPCRHCRQVHLHPRWLLWCTTCQNCAPVAKVKLWAVRGLLTLSLILLLWLGRAALLWLGKAGLRWPALKLLLNVVAIIWTTMLAAEARGFQADVWSPFRGRRPKAQHWRWLALAFFVFPGVAVAAVAMWHYPPSITTCLPALWAPLACAAAFNAYAPDAVWAPWCRACCSAAAKLAELAGVWAAPAGSLLRSWRAGLCGRHSRVAAAANGTRSARLARGKRPSRKAKGVHGKGR